MKNPLSLNLYTYVENNPLKYNDPSGHTAMTVDTIAENSGGGAVAALALTLGIANALDEPDYWKRRDDLNFLYHATTYKGADSILSIGIDLTVGRNNLDFGKGFYLTNDLGQAKDWIDGRFGGEGVILVFSIDPEDMKKFKGKIFNGPTKNWRDFVVSNRKGAKLHNYDYVEGPYLANPRDLGSNRKLVGKGHQISIHSLKMAVWLMSNYSTYLKY